jgi:hypothetical protein
MKLLKTLTRQAFHERFPDADSCYSYLASIKWKQGYTCKRCGHSRWYAGSKPHSRRCLQCKYDESPTAHTLFHKLKFNLHTAFLMLYEISTSKKGSNSIWLAERFGVQQKTAWLFRQKVQEAMESSRQYPLSDHVHVDEFEIGTPQPGEYGRSKTEKKARVVIALEYRKGKPGRGYAQVIGDYSSGTLIKIFDDHIDPTAQIETDGWSAYGAIKSWYKGIEQKLSNKGQNFNMLHIQIRNLKNWLRGVHSFCEAGYLQKYLNEYFFRFNRRNNRTNILDRLMERIVATQPATYSMIRARAA